MKILIANSIFHPNVIGGAEGAALLLAQQLSERGIAVDVLATTGRRGGNSYGLQRRTLAGIAGTIYEAPSWGLYDLLPAPGQRPPPVLVRGAHHFLGTGSPRWRQLARQAIRDCRPDVLHTHTIVGMTPSIWRAASQAGIPIVHTLHDYHLLCPRTTLLRSRGHNCEEPPLPCRILAHLKLAATRQVAVVTAPSRYVLQRHLQAGGFAEARAEVVPNACLLPPTPRTENRHPEHVQGLFLGQIDTHKGIPVLLAAIEQVLAAGPPDRFRFAFAGAGPLADRVQAFCAKQSERARYCGVVSGAAKEALLAESSFLVLPSLWHDNFPLVILEAFNYSLPVIGARRGGIPEIITDGHSGLIVEPEVEPLAAAIGRYARDGELRAQHGAGALARAGTYSVQRHVASFLAIYEQLAGGNARPG